jgi:hypothetical protein
MPAGYKDIKRLNPELKTAMLNVKEQQNKMLMGIYRGMNEKPV